MVGLGVKVERIRYRVYQSDRFIPELSDDAVIGDRGAAKQGQAKALIVILFDKL
jgi:hypothetical protein